MNCTEKGCTKPARKRGLCFTHYARARRHGKFITTLCSVENCGRNVDSQGLCTMHYTRLRSTGDPEKLKIAEHGSQTGPCSFEGCDRPKYCKDLCELHYRRLYAHGDPSVRLTPEPGQGKGWIDKDGYRSVSYRTFSNSRKTWKREHRVVMERALGRELKPTEHIHHVNGNKLDNRIENLVVVSAAEHTVLHFHTCPNCGYRIKPPNDGTTKV